MSFLCTALIDCCNQTLKDKPLLLLDAITDIVSGAEAASTRSFVLSLVKHLSTALVEAQALASAPMQNSKLMVNIPRMLDSLVQLSAGCDDAALSIDVIEVFTKLVRQVQPLVLVFISSMSLVLLFVIHVLCL